GGVGPPRVGEATREAKPLVVERGLLGGGLRSVQRRVERGYLRARHAGELRRALRRLLVAVAPLGEGIVEGAQLALLLRDRLEQLGRQVVSLDRTHPFSLSLRTPRAPTIRAATEYGDSSPASKAGMARSRISRPPAAT